MIQPIACLVALALVAAPPAPAPSPPPPPPGDDATAIPTPIQPGTDEPPPPTLTPKPTQPGAPKRVYMPGGKKEEVVLPTPVEPTPVKPTPVLPTGPTPVLPGSDPEEPGSKTQPATHDEPRGRRPRRERRPRATGADTGSPTGRCFEQGTRCQLFVGTGIALSIVGAGVIGGGAALTAQPVQPVRSDPTQVTSYKPPGIAMIGVGSVALVAGIVLIATGVVGHKRDQALRRQSAWWRPRFSAGIIW